MMTLVCKEIEYLPVNGNRLAIHKWIPATVKGIVFYFHGLQSHGCWLWEAGQLFAASGLAFICIDRPGSGMSEGLRGEFPPPDQLLSSYARAIAHCRDALPAGVPVNLFGHCLGGSVLAALLNHDDFSTEFDSVVFCSTWLGKLHVTLAETELARLRDDESDAAWDAGLRPEDFTAEQQYVQFIQEDALATRTLTRRSRKHLLELERRYLGMPWRWSKPVVYISGFQDKVVNLSSALSVFQELTKGHGVSLKLPTDKHYLFFTEAKRALVEWVSSITLGRRALDLA
jgi:alpha-beta hydrolase superfamily lysophospholipase